MDKKENTKNQKKSGSKNSRIFSAVITMVISVALLSVTSYAWFKLVNSPKVEQITLKAGTSGSLEISATENGTYGDTLNITTIPENACLRPITTLDGSTFYRPVYFSDGTVSSINSTAVTPAELAGMVNKSEADGGYIIQTEFYLRASVNSLSQIGIKLVAPGANIDGTKITNSVTGKNGAEAVRVSFSTNTSTVIFEPNADAAIPNRTGQVALTNFAAVNTIKQSASNYLFYNVATSAYDSGNSEELFKIPTNTPVKVTMTIWLEGADPDCINEITGNIVNSTIQFISTDIE